jgi:hypothetical protein
LASVIGTQHDEANMALAIAAFCAFALIVLGTFMLTDTQSKDFKID